MWYFSYDLHIMFNYAITVITSEYMFPCFPPLNIYIKTVVLKI